MVKKSKILRIVFDDIILVHEPKAKKVEECFKNNRNKKVKKKNE